jgi:hypothetical protein
MSFTFASAGPFCCASVDVSCRPRAVPARSSRAVGGLRPEQKCQPSNVVGQVHQPDLHRGSDRALGPHQDAALARVLVAEDMLDAGADLRAPNTLADVLA